MYRSLALWLWLAAFLPLASPPARELPGSGSLPPPLVATPDTATSVPVPGALDLTPASGFS